MSDDADVDSTGGDAVAGRGSARPLGIRIGTPSRAMRWETLAIVAVLMGPVFFVS